MFKTSVYFVFISIFVFLLQACGTAGTGGGAATGSGVDSGDGTSGSDNQTFSVKETINLRIEANDEMLASWQNDVFKLITPQQAYAFEGLSERNNISVNRISIVSLNHNFKEQSDGSIPPYRVRKGTDGTGFELQFDSAYIEQVNFVIRVRFSNGETLYAPLYSLNSTSESIIVNAASHYVLKKLFDTIETSEELDALLPCNISNCPNQPLAKAALLEQIDITAQSYEITFPSTANINDALELLDEQIDFKSHIEIAVAEISRTISPIAKGIPRAFAITDGQTITRLTHNTEYNSLRFALSLNDFKPENNKREIVIATETSKIIPEGDSDNVLPVYPGFNQSSSMLDVKKEVLSSDIPFTRTPLSISEANNFTIDNDEPINSFSSLISDTFTSTEGFLLNQRILEQVVPSSQGIQNIGWQFNPLFSKLYHANEYEPSATLENTDNTTPDYGASPTWLLGANYSTGGSFQVTKVGNKFNRGTQLEALNIFSWEIHGQKTDDSFSLNDIDGDYGVINYSLKLADNGTAISLFAESEKWDVSNGDVSVTQPTSYRSYTLNRTIGNPIVAPVNESSSISNPTHSISTVFTKESSQEFPNGNTEIQGLIRLDGGSSAPEGHSTQNGQHFTFVFEEGFGKDGEERGRGITIATKLLDAQPIFPVQQGDNLGLRYNLLGNTFGINNEKNTLRNINNSVLILSDRIASGNDCHASIEVSSVSVEHIAGTDDISTNLNENTLSSPIEAKSQNVSSSSCILDGNAITIEFNAVPNDGNLDKALTLKGFVSPHNDENNNPTPGNLISLMWIQEDNLGLIFANRDQELSPSFD